MIVAKNIGRLGNNMFQISAALGYARKYGYEWAVDPSSGYGEPYSSIHQTYPGLPKGQLSGTRYHEHPHGICHVHNISYDLCHFNYHPIPDLGPNVTLSGFFQSYKYFENSQEEIKKVFGLPHWMEYEDSVSIHVRRGDYVQHSGSFPPVDVRYLSQAIGKMHDQTGIAKFVVFSDDIPWCKENIPKTIWKDFNFEYSIGRSERQDLEIGMSCSHHIIANSTFSWWQAYLGHNPKRVVISPSCVRGNWFGLESGIKQDAVDLLPSDWTQIKFR